MSSELHVHDKSHYHRRHEQLAESRRAEGVLWLVSALSVIFIISEVIGGYLASSLAILTDAGHLFSDLLSFLISILAIRLARRRESRSFTFGYGRAEVLGALASIIILWILTVYLVIIAGHRIAAKEYDVDADIMCLTSLAGVVFNLMMACVLHVGSVEHSHSHSGTSNGHKNMNVRAAAIHVVGDLIQSVGVLIAALIIKFTGWNVADPICTFVFSLIVLVTTVAVVKDILFVLMEGAAGDVNAASVENSLASLNGVKLVTKVHVWCVAVDDVRCVVELVFDESENVSEVTERVREHLAEKFDVSDAVVAVASPSKSFFKVSSEAPPIIPTHAAKF